MIQQAGYRSLCIGSAYRPPSTGLGYVEELEASINNIVEKPSPPNIALFGDFNLPDICWDSEPPTVNPTPQYGMGINEKFLEVVQGPSLSQVVLTPTRGQNILDLALVSNPDLVENVSTCPGISDHEAVAHDKLVVDGRGKAEVLSKQYDSIFTEEDLTKVPELGASPYPDMPEVESSRSPAHLYFMFNEPLNHNNQHPYLGVILSRNLRWKAHINDITAKASSTLGFVRRNLRGAMIEWNALPAHLVMAKSVEHFKAGVASHYGFPSCTQL
ncbi:hypothetical protein Bbelb_070740 [Branchiostoma belcheri]|nr:hypothetical protein Bbelb_070740 [Branchiostoma belcheri]